MSPPQIPPPFDTIRRWSTCPRQGGAISRVAGIDCALGTTVGLRREENEDRVCFVRYLNARGDVMACLAIVCDGLGGMEDGGLCADIAVSSIVLNVGHRISVVPPQSALAIAIEYSNRQIYDLYRGSGGTTVCAVLVWPNGACAITAGDSRIYASPRGARAVQISTDDTIAMEIERLNEGNAGSLGALDFAEHLTQFLGVGRELRLNHVALSGYRVGARIVLATDGAWKSNASLTKLMAFAGSSEELASRVVSVSDWCGGIDNTSVLVLPELSQLFEHRLQSVSGPVASLEVWTPYGMFVSSLTQTSRFGIASRSRDDTGSEVRAPKSRRHRGSTRTDGSNSQLPLGDGGQREDGERERLARAGRPKHVDIVVRDESPHGVAHSPASESSEGEEKDGDNRRVK